MSDLGFAVKWAPFAITGVFAYAYFVNVVGLAPGDPNVAAGFVLFGVSVGSFVGLGMAFWQRPEWTKAHDIELPAMLGAPAEDLPEETRITFDAVLSFGYALLLLILGGAAAGLY